MPKQLKFYAALIGILLVSIFIGNALAEGDYRTLSLLLLAALSVAAIVVPGYGFFLALGILCPFSFPIPYVYRFPFLAIILALCCAKYAVTQALTSGRLRLRYISGATILILFGWVFIRYCMNPVKPGLAIGSGNAVTGFRAYLNYGICFGLVMLVPLLIRTRDDAVKLLRWLGYLSAFFILLLLPLVFSRSPAVVRTLAALGAAVGFFDNGWVRFISLPGFGLILLTLALLPQIAPLPFSLRVLTLLLASAAIIFGGNRASLIMAMVIFLCVAVVRRRPGLVFSVICGIACVLGTLYVLGENMRFVHGVGFLRVAALVSPRAAERSEAWQTVVWRKLRWERAMQDIKRKPWVGTGYGGLSAIFTFGSAEELEQNLIEIDVVSGSIHNGFLAAARALGVPFALFFASVLGTRIWRHGRDAMQQSALSPLQGELHTFLFAYLCALPLAIYIGLDLNSFDLWFYLSLGFTVSGCNAGAPLARATREKDLLFKSGQPVPA